jgi:hypothetical protein
MALAAIVSNSALPSGQNLKAQHQGVQPTAKILQVYIKPADVPTTNGCVTILHCLQLTTVLNITPTQGSFNCPNTSAGLLSWMQLHL